MVFCTIQAIRFDLTVANVAGKITDWLLLKRTIINFKALPLWHF